MAAFPRAHARRSILSRSLVVKHQQRYHDPTGGDRD
jgi:hypothetical protein